MDTKEFNRMIKQIVEITQDEKAENFLNKIKGI